MVSKRTLLYVMQNDNGELELWEHARHNDGKAFAELFDRHQNRVFTRSLGLMGNRHDAEDVVAAAFFELWRKRRSVRIVDGSVLPWLLVTTVNLARNGRRSRVRYEKFLRAAPRVETVGGPDGEPIETRQRLADSLARLSPADGALLVLTSLEGLSVAEAAAAVGLKPATARVRLHRARSRLRVDLHDLNPISDPAKGTS